MAIDAPISASHGDTKTEPAKNENKNPPNVPAKVLPRFNGKDFFGIILPIMEAVLSPNAKIAMAALFAG